MTMGTSLTTVLLIFTVMLASRSSHDTKQHVSTGFDSVQTIPDFSFVSSVQLYVSQHYNNIFGTGQQTTTIAVTQNGIKRQHSGGVWRHLLESNVSASFYVVAIVSRNSTFMRQMLVGDWHELALCKIVVLLFELRVMQFDPVQTALFSQDLHFHIYMRVSFAQRRIHVVRKDFVEMQPQCLFVYRDISIASTTVLADYSSQTCLTSNTNVAPKPRPPNDTELNMTRLKRTVSDTTLMQNVPNNSSALRRDFASRRPHNSGRPLKILPHKQLLHQHRWTHISVMQLLNFVLRHLLLAVITFLQLHYLVFAGKYSSYMQVENSTKIPPKDFLRSVLKTFFQRFICVKENSKYWLCKSILDDSSCGLSEKYDQTFFYGKLHHDTCSTGNGTDRLKGCLSTLARQLNIVTWPVTRFLPDTTNNPALDLAHLGYRLATLSAVPPSVPVSRVRLADAGFTTEVKVTR
ncbi:hypothetical protein BaRGS_00015645 [Batillaria attramentaria]|uniref:Uncharacterized protein n=1 Tax=Batillaria attramentaria TaxID=370345 RepID=A0ABD0L0U2_9CAEN